MSEKYTPADGDPVDMSQFTLGERYGSEDMYRDMGIVPGSKVAYEKDGVIYTDTVEAVRWQSPEWVAPPERSWWQRVVRKLTPRRLRKPLPQSPPKPARVTISVGERGSDPMKRAQAQMGKTLEFIEGLRSDKPGVGGDEGESKP